ncbi:unnamed protein product [Schistosoma curassoni]|uniref:Reverse transcriptase domain-containing protein n=1 Tax=Schistosoma curassoni TaxID=6186 RepID=A0A183L4H2_9TREM|nr:unnamed protein product [Schistosoma curassoni]
MNGPAPLMNPSNMKAAHTKLPVAVATLTIEEIMVTTRQINSRKATGPDNMPPEALKSFTEVTANMLHVLFRRCWELHVPLTGWEEGNLIKIPRKEDLSKCENYKGNTTIRTRKGFEQSFAELDEKLSRRPASKSTD